jgi:hypothetical protein
MLHFSTKFNYTVQKQRQQSYSLFVYAIVLMSTYTQQWNTNVKTEDAKTTSNNDTLESKKRAFPYK